MPKVSERQATLAQIDQTLELALFLPSVGQIQHCTASKFEIKSSENFLIEICSFDNSIVLDLLVFHLQYKIVSSFVNTLKLVF